MSVISIFWWPPASLPSVHPCQHQRSPRAQRAHRGRNCRSEHSADQGAAVATIHLHQTTTATPEQFLAGLTDFGPGRSELFGNSADSYLKVHDRGPHEAD